MPKRGRAPGFRMPDEHRHKIGVSNLVTYLEDHAAGKREMSATQVQAANILLKKCMPDLASTTVEGNTTHTLVINHVVREIVHPTTNPPQVAYTNGANGNAGSH